jgi:hypothetical protein
VPLGSGPVWTPCQANIQYGFPVGTASPQGNYYFGSTIAVPFPVCPASHNSTCCVPGASGFIGAVFCVRDEPLESWYTNPTVFPGDQYKSVRGCTLGRSVPYPHSVLSDGRPICGAHSPENMPCYYDCECVHCPPGFHFDGRSQYCCSTFPCCSADNCYCAVTGVCIPCTPPGPNCVWDPLVCDWNCDPCGPGECYRESTDECVDEDGDGIDCGEGCEWSRSSCECRCCGPGTCWCEPSRSCVPCLAECTVELNCDWNKTTCAWNCDEPDCDTETERWDWDICACVPKDHDYGPDEEGATPWVAIDSAARIHHAYVQESGRVRYRVWTHFSVATPLVDNTEGPAGRRPRMEMVPGHPTGRVTMVLEVGGGVSTTSTDDDGRTWSEMATQFPPPANRPTIAVQRTSGIVAIAAWMEGRLVGRWRAPGEVSFRPQYVFKRWTGAELVDLEVAETGFHLQPVPGASGVWFLTCVTPEGVKNFFSFDLQTWSDAPAS